MRRYNRRVCNRANRQDTFNPGQLFAGGAPGFFFNQALPNVHFQDFAMTPATTLGNSIRLILDALSLGREKAGFLPGAAGAFYSHPDTAGVSITGDIDIRGERALYAVPPTVNSVIAAKYQNAGDQRSYSLYANTGGKLEALFSTDGTANPGVTLFILESTATLASVGVTAGVSFWSRVTLDVDDGAGDAVCTFWYYLGDGVPTADDFEQLGDPVLLGTTISIFDSSALLTVGASNDDGSANYGSGKAYRALIYAGLDSSDLRADFNPNLYPGTGSTIPDGVSGNWTRNGTAFIAGDGLHAVAPSDAARMQRARMPHGGRRNLYTHTDLLGNAAWLKSDVTVTGNNRVEGTTASWLLRENKTVTSGSVVTISGYVQSNTGLSQGFRIYGQDGTHISGDQTATTTRQRFQYTFTQTSSGAFGYGLRANVAGDTVDLLVDGMQMEYAASATALQTVGEAYDTTESGVPSVTWLYGNGTQYYSILGSRNLTCMHDGTGGFVGMNVYVNKADDGAADFMAGSTGGTAIGFNMVQSDITTNVAKMTSVVGNGSATIISLTSADNAVPRFTPFAASFSYLENASPEGAISVDGVVVASGNSSGSPSAAQASADIALFNHPGTGNEMPGYLGSVVMGNIASAAQQAQVNTWLAGQSG